MTISGFLSVFLGCIIIKSESKSRTQPDLEKIKVFGSGKGVCPPGVTGNRMCVDSIISNSPAGLSVGTKSLLLSRMH